MFPVGSNRVLRRYHDRTRSAADEAALMQWLRSQGYPVPRVFNLVESGMVVERVHGPTLAQHSISGLCSPEIAGAVLADLHDRLHRMDASTAPIGQRDAQQPRDSLLHLDLHPQNVLLRDADVRQPVVIDWSTAALGAPGLDVARTALILARVALNTVASNHEQAGASVLRQLGVFISKTNAPPVPHLESASEQLACNPLLTAAEVAQLPAACRIVGRVHAELDQHSSSGA